ncbi:MAG: VWA domain-containing protein [Acidobacteriota bacterium]|nr:MAG: VWA domain-containing protein [Acidobacteriota bacterium]
MKRSSTLRRFAVPALSAILLFAFAAPAYSQSRPQRPKTTTEKKNQRPVGLTEEEIRKQAEERRLEEEARNAPLDDDPLEIEVDLVNVNTVVYNKKTGAIITGLKRENFAVYEDGVKQEITNFAEPEAPITVTLVVEYSKWSEIFGYYGSSGQEYGHLEVIRPVAAFVSRFIKPPNDYASVVAFDIRPTPITDFTNDPNRLQATVNLLLRNRPAFRENNLYDAIKFALMGGTADSVVLENSEQRKIEYGGMVDVKAPRRAIILVASGIDTFSRLNPNEARRVVQEAGIPIYIISTGNMFYKMYEHRLPAVDGIDGTPGRLTFLQARNQMNTWARDSGGRHFEMTFPGEIPSILESINALMRHQYSIAYDLGEKRPPGKKYKLEVKVDVNGDGKYEEKGYVIQHRPYFVTEEEKKDDDN